MAVTAIVAAGGSGSRLGHAEPKALVPLGGVPMVRHAVANLADSGVVDSIVVTAPRDNIAQVTDALTDLPVPVTVVAGGASRAASVLAGLAALPDNAEYVLVHDAARPFASPELVRRVVAALHDGQGAVVPSVPVTDTIKQLATASFAIGEPYRQSRVTDSNAPVPEVIQVAYTPVRQNLRAAQTPQGFSRALLERAYASPSPRAAIATDDAGLVEALGEKVVTVLGEEAAAKITTERDLQLAQIMYALPEAAQ